MQFIRGLAHTKTSESLVSVFFKVTAFLRIRLSKSACSINLFFQAVTCTVSRHFILFLSHAQSFYDCPESFNFARRRLEVLAVCVQVEAEVVVHCVENVVVPRFKGADRMHWE